HSSKNFRGKTRAPHAEQHDVCVAVAPDTVREGPQPTDRVGHQRRRAEPPEPIRNFFLNTRFGAPERWIAPPQRRRCRVSPCAVADRNRRQGSGGHPKRTAEPCSLRGNIKRRPNRGEIVRDAHFSSILFRERWPEASKVKMSNISRRKHNGRNAESVRSRPPTSSASSDDGRSSCLSRVPKQTWPPPDHPSIVRCWSRRLPCFASGSSASSSIWPGRGTQGVVKS